MDTLLTWLCESPKLFLHDANEKILLGNNTNGAKPLKYETLQEFMDESQKFPIEFPIETSRCKRLINGVPESVLLNNINSVYPVLHEAVLPLFIDFIKHKRKFGTDEEQEFYKDMTLLELVDKLLNKRAVVFLSASDNYLLINGERGVGGWETVGTEKEKGSSLHLRNCLSYDEMKLSALLSVSSHTYFVNDGSRSNCGVIATNRKKIEEVGVVIGLIGTRLKKKEFMEYQDIIIKEEQNIESKGYGEKIAPTMKSLFSGFYGKPNWTYSNFKISENNLIPDLYKEILKDIYFDNVTFCKRVAISFDTLLFEANHRAREKNTTAFVHVVGLSLGFWRVSNHQEKLFFDTCVKRIEILGQYLHNISDIYFACFQSLNCCQYTNDSKVPIPGHPLGGVQILIGRRKPHEALVGDDKGKLLVVSYAWDCNALPGNEYWIGSLSSSGEPAAACSTQIPEIHNPHINRLISGSNLKIAARGRIYSFKEYMEENKKWNFQN